MGFGALDSAILLVYLVGITTFGSLFARYQRTTRDYFLGGRDVAWWAIAFSIVATETSTLTFIGAPATAYTGDMTFLQLVFGYVIGRVLVSAIFIPAYFRGKLDTAYQLMRARFGPRVRDLMAVLFLVTRALADGVRLFATALVLAVTIGLAHVWGVPGDIFSIAVIGLFTILYTFLGGMAAVIWTDVIQLLIYVGGATLALYELVVKLPGGWRTAMTMADAAGKLRVFNLSTNLAVPYTLWAGILGGVFLTLATHGTDQLMVQRLLSARSQRDSSRALIASGIIVLAQFVLFLLIGVLLFVFYTRFPLALPLRKADEIFPRFIVTELPTGMPGIVIAAIFAAAMSTLSGSLNSMSSVSVNDLYRTRINPGADEATLLRWSRWLTVGWGLVQMGVAVLARNWGSVLEVGLAIASFIFGSILGVFLLGTFDRRAGEHGALAGMAAGLSAMLYVRFFTQIAWTWYVLIGSITTVIVGAMVSRVADRRPAALLA